MHIQNVPLQNAPLQNGPFQNVPSQNVPHKTSQYKTSPYKCFKKMYSNCLKNTIFDEILAKNRIFLQNSGEKSKYQFRQNTTCP